ncbi:MAG: hypothetical protein KGH69_02950 [Candidatus Micrarchaeota archaeon]|nr:hypothetical protein [Candidatus Micrarchaeota archaeon]MDE1851620.1 hypothetical protein [Candidatus Micrarchaeota archaeon]
MGFFDLFGKKDVSKDLGRQMPYAIKTELVPYKMKANVRSSSSLRISLKNQTGEPVVSSVVVEVPERISLDETGFTKQKEVRLGTLAPDEEKDAIIGLFGDSGTDKGEYTLTITAFVHYRDYAHVLNAMKKRTIVEAV